MAAHTIATGRRWTVPSANAASVLVGWVAVLATVATDTVALVPAVRFAYHAPGLHVALETSAALVAALAGYLALGRFKRSGLVADLLLFASLIVMSLASVVTAAVPSSPQSPGATGLMWLAAVSATIGAGLFAFSAVVPQRVVQNVARAERRAVGALAAGVVVLALATLLLVDLLPVAVEPGFDPRLSERPQLAGHPSLLILQLLGLALFTIAAVGFTRRFAVAGDDFLRWLGVAAVLGAAARANYMLYPSTFSDYVYTGDMFRLLFYVVVLLAAAREIRRYWEKAADAAVLEERRRLARDLHDGLAQELGFVLRNVRGLAAAEPAAGRISSGVARALDESRRAIAALTEPLDEPLESALERVARDAARRAGTNVRLDVTPGIAVSRDEREALSRIAAEAVANAGRHAGVPLVDLSCTTGDDRVRLRVADAGSGFEPEQRAAYGSEGFGLISMREHAVRIGAELAIHSRRGVGTTVEVTL